MLFHRGSRKQEYFHTNPDQPLNEGWESIPHTCLLCVQAELAARERAFRQIPSGAGAGGRWATCTVVTRVSGALPHLLNILYPPLANFYQAPVSGLEICWIPGPIWSPASSLKGRNSLMTSSLKPCLAPLGPRCFLCPDSHSKNIWSGPGMFLKLHRAAIGVRLFIHMLWCCAEAVLHAGEDCWLLAPQNFLSKKEDRYFMFYHRNNNNNNYM